MEPVRVGIDLGTSSVKVVAVDAGGQVLARSGRGYPVHAPSPGWAEQDPDEWWSATAAAVREVVGAVDRVDAVGLSGQMHGLVAVDGAGRPVHPAVIWPDTRSGPACAELVERIRAERVYALTGVPVTTGFLAPSLLWLRATHPALFGRVDRVLLPKDYIRLRLTGDLATDRSDASGTLLLDVRDGTWSGEILDALDLDRALLPPIRAAADLAGTVTARASDETGLPVDTPVVTGAGDQMAGALAMGLTTPGTAAAVIGTGGQLITIVGEPVLDPTRRIQTFAHATPGLWLLMGALLAAGQSLDWLAGTLGAPLLHLVGAAEQVPPGADGLLFLPYLNGVRTPYVDARARGCFVGLGLSHGPGHLTRAVLEGVAFAMRECLDAMRDLGIEPATLVCSGGGARLPLWRRIQASVYGRPLLATAEVDHSAIGAALLATAALAGAGSAPPTGPSPGPSLGRGTAEPTVVAPDPMWQPVYESRYAAYRTLYPALRDTFH